MTQILNSYEYFPYISFGKLPKQKYQKKITVKITYYHVKLNIITY